MSKPSVKDFLIFPFLHSHVFVPLLMCVCVYAFYDSYSLYYPPTRERGNQHTPVAQSIKLGEQKLLNNIALGTNGDAKMLSTKRRDKDSGIPGDWKGSRWEAHQDKWPWTKGGGVRDEGSPRIPGTKGLHKDGRRFRQSHDRRNQLVRKRS